MSGEILETFEKVALFVDRVDELHHVSVVDATKNRHDVFGKSFAVAEELVMLLGGGMRKKEESVSEVELKAIHQTKAPKCVIMRLSGSALVVTLLATAALCAPGVSHLRKLQEAAEAAPEGPHIGLVDNTGTETAYPDESVGDEWFTDFAADILRESPEEAERLSSLTERERSEIALNGTLEAASCNWYALACINNNVRLNVNYKYKWGNGPWRSDRVNEGWLVGHYHRYDHCNENKSPKLVVEFDGDLTGGFTWKKYLLNKYASPHKNCHEGGKQYCFEYVASSGLLEIDLFQC
uniref:Uncharacterized protein n=1 Tax=Chromera velia CCMP2878 TaxID=1169474 RepID=A0A0G4G920_9ALVE|eukprot:Cvel_20809.t1-p1 / transcript=Cvel_20809.t1 / gene=Cvel_20809 / organism=Chromera_velia_CCMP2878 / gene_product=hypothetical protein / transcript_product=hypothetical protein / location=Cvel_scaffold1901:19093-23313(-) / protein_length=294 / sequence_SO=supercontig / SO=protein_coding / is_pseudo=false